MKRRRPLIGLPIVALALTAGCTTVQSKNDASAPDHGISADKVVTLGTFQPQSGNLAVAGDIGLGAELYFDKVNKAGGVDGYTFKLKREDDGADPTRSVSAARKLWEDDKVFGLFQPFGSGPNNAVKQYAEANHIPVIFPYADSRIYFPAASPANPRAFGLNAPYDKQVATIVKYAHDTLGTKKVAVLHTTDDFGQAGRNATEQTAKALGLDVVADIGYGADETNFAPYGRRLAQSGAQAVVVWAITGAAKVMSAASSSGYGGQWLLNDSFRGGFFLDSIAKIPQLAGRTYVISASRLPTDPAVRDFASAFAAAYTKHDADQGLAGWSAAELFVKAAKVATSGGKPLNWAGLRGAFESLHGVDAGGYVNVSFSKTDHVGTDVAQILRLGGGSALTQVRGFERLAD